MKITLNTDEDVVRTIKEGLKLKDGYCPCKLEKLPKTNVCAKNSAIR